MSTNYYIFNRKKREEIQEFNRFWEETFIPGLKQQVEDTAVSGMEPMSTRILGMK